MKLRKKIDIFDKALHEQYFINPMASLRRKQIEKFVKGREVATLFNQESLAEFMLSFDNTADQPAPYPEQEEVLVCTCMTPERYAEIQEAQEELFWEMVEDWRYENCPRHLEHEFMFEVRGEL